MLVSLESDLLFVQTNYDCAIGESQPFVKTLLHVCLLI